MLNSLNNIFDLQKQRKGISINPVNIETKRGVVAKRDQTPILRSPNRNDDFNLNNLQKNQKPKLIGHIDWQHPD